MRRLRAESSFSTFASFLISLLTDYFISRTLNTERHKNAGSLVDHLTLLNPLERVDTERSLHRETWMWRNSPLEPLQQVLG